MTQHSRLRNGYLPKFQIVSKLNLTGLDETMTTPSMPLTAATRQFRNTWQSVCDQIIGPTVLVSTGRCQRPRTEIIASVIRQPTGATEGATDSSRVDQYNLSISRFLVSVRAYPPSWRRVLHASAVCLARRSRLALLVWRDEV